MRKKINWLRSKKMQIIGFVSGILISCSPVNDHPFKEKQPNIIFILVDDLGYGDVGFNGSTYFETPNIDALARESLIFDNSYMYPTCSPSRSALFTGKQSYKTGVYTVPVLEKGDSSENIFSRWTIGKEHPIYAEPLADAGYQSIHLGKWHIVGPFPQEERAMDWPISSRLAQPDPGDFTWVDEHKTEAVLQYYPEGRGFIKNVGGTFRGDPALEQGGYKSKTGGYRAPFSNPFIEPKEDDEWLTDRLTDEAIEFMDNNKDSPTLVNLHYYTVHRPIISRSEKLFQKYMEKPGDSISGQGLKKNKERTAKYATMLESLDDNIGRLLDYLNRNGLRENTMIIFSSDNGYHSMASNNKQMRGSKGYIYEGGIRVPTFFNWKGRIAPRRSVAPISVVDYFPTIVDVAGIDYVDNDLDGESLVSMFKEDSGIFLERPLYWHLASRFKHGTCSVVRKGKYKLIQFLADGELELYNLALDPLESNNLTFKEPRVTQELLSNLEQWRLENKVPLPPNSILEH